MNALLRSSKRCMKAVRSSLPPRMPRFRVSYAACNHSRISGK